MIVHLNSYHILVLELVEEKGRYSPNEIAQDLYHDIPKYSMKETLEFVIGKKLLIISDDKDAYDDDYKLSALGKQCLLDIRTKGSKEATSNINVIGSYNQIHSSAFKSFNADASSQTPRAKSKMDVPLILKIIAGIIAIVLAILKGCSII